MRLPVAVLVAALAGSLAIAANAGRFTGARPEIRTKQFDFLPGPEVARLIAPGHASTAAKLRWIDSFAWFQWQLDHPSVTREVQGRSAMARLYDTLTALDPRFEPFYLHANLNLSGVMGRQREALSVLARGTLDLPASMAVWRNLVTELVVHYRIDEHHPAIMADILDAWASSVPASERGGIWQWRLALGRRKSLGLEQVDYWVARLAETPPGSPYEAFLVDAARDAAGRLARARLNAVLSIAPPGSGPEALSDPALIARAFPRGLPPGYPLVDGILQPDPWGHPWRVAGTTAFSVGLAIQAQARRVGSWNNVIRQRTLELGRGPVDGAEARAWAEAPAPEGGVGVEWDGRALELRSPPPSAQPWDPRPR